jgi:hypothetical protein
MSAVPANIESGRRVIGSAENVTSPAVAVPSALEADADVRRAIAPPRIGGIVHRLTPPGL